MRITGKSIRLKAFAAVSITLVLLLNACALVQTPAMNTGSVSPTTNVVQVGVKDAAVKTELRFTATLPVPLETDQSLALEILDEVTGLALNPQRHKMDKIADNLYSLKLSFVLGSVVKYRYVREGAATAFEYNSLGKQVRYRLFKADNPATINDLIIAWNNLPFSGGYGRIIGRVLESGTDIPITGSLVTAGGQSTQTASDGSFIIDRLPPGIHNVVVYSLDGTHTVFQQEAEVAPDSATPADIRVSTNQNVEVTFVVQPPEGSLVGIPIRLVGNTYPLGNTFADLKGGMSVLASRAPLLRLREDGKYEITLTLPVGFDLRYKYTVGDGFWNAERTSAGNFQTRQLIIPATPVTIEETIETWSTAQKGAITFRVTVPESTPPTDTISIQFNPFGWTEPIPMWPLGNHQWLYILYSPLDLIGQTAYRFCRNEQCGIADDIQTKGIEGVGNLFTPSSDPQVLRSDVTEWQWTMQATEPITVPSGDIPSKSDTFMTAVEFSADYHPSWQPYFPQAFNNVRQLASKWVILNPTWHFAEANPPILAPITGVDPSWYDLSQEISLATQKGLNVAIHPVTAYYQPSMIWWADAARDSNWWQTWFDRYETFILNHADLAARSGVKILIIGDENISPALPGGLLVDGNTSGVPGDADVRWRSLIAKVRERYQGRLGWYLVSPAGLQNPPAFLSDVDDIFVLVTDPLAEGDQPNENALKASAKKIVETNLLTLRDRFDKSLHVGISYPSAVGAASGCVKSGDACLPRLVLEQAGVDIATLQPDGRIQAQIYNSILQVVSESEWVAGVFTSGFFPPVGIADLSVSVHGKPASDVIWFWFDHFNPAGE